MACRGEELDGSVEVLLWRVQVAVADHAAGVAHAEVVADDRIVLARSRASRVERAPGETPSLREGETADSMAQPYSWPLEDGTGGYDIRFPTAILMVSTVRRLEPWLSAAGRRAVVRLACDVSRLTRSCRVVNNLSCAATAHEGVVASG
eukprot:scaffold89550_cov76-Phaeocystis_antarctica.AAC.1